MTIRPVCSWLLSVLEQESLGTGWMNCLDDSSPLATPKGSRTQLRVGRDLLDGNNTEGKHQRDWTWLTVRGCVSSGILESGAPL